MIPTTFMLSIYTWLSLLKQLVLKNITKILGVLLLIPLLAMIQCCQKLSDMHTRDLTLSSDEFTNYVNSSMDYFGTLMEGVIEFSKTSSTDNKSIMEEKVIQIRGGFKIKCCSTFIINIKHKEMQNKLTLLYHNFPDIINYSPEIIENYVLKSYSKPLIYNTISQHFLHNQLSKVSQIKGDPVLGIPQPGETNFYYNYGQAFAEALSYSFTSQVEIGGLVFSDGTAMVYNYAAAQHDRTMLTPSLSFTGYSDVIVDNYGTSFYWDGSEYLQVAATFHTHFYSSNLDLADNDIQSAFFPNCSLIILLDSCWASYNYSNGVPAGGSPPGEELDFK
jgi:hypothetical protein